jgi:hypothetical protein
MDRDVSRACLGHALSRVCHINVVARCPEFPNFQNHLIRRPVPVAFLFSGPFFLGSKLSHEATVAT